jgi:hypothetical protein
VASLNQINAGVTTTVDTSQVSHTPAHTDACIAGLNESGRRAVFAYSSGQGSASQFPQDLTRLTLALHTGLNADHWKLARSLGAAIVMHFINGDLQAMKNAGLLSNWSREEKYCPLRAPTPNTSTARRSTKPLGD